MRLLHRLFLRSSARRLSGRLMAAGALLLALSPGITSAGAAESAADGLSVTPPDNRMVCKKVRPTGSKIPRKVCKTQSTIAAEQAKSERQMNELKRQQQAEVLHQQQRGR